MPFICKMMQSRKAKESVSDCSKTGLCIKSKVYGCCPEETHESKKEGKDQESIKSSPHQTQDTNWKVITSQLDITNESQEVSPFQARDHKASINRRARKHNTKKKNNLNVTGVQVFRLQRGTCIKGLFWPLLEPNTESCFSPISSYLKKSPSVKFWHLFIFYPLLWLPKWPTK